MSPSAPLQTLATAAPGPVQRLVALLTCIAFAIATAALVPIAAQPMGPMPGFVPAYQTALIVTYGVTTYLFFAQYRRTGSRPLLVLAAGSLFTTLVVFVQLLTFPNVFAPGRLVGSGPDTTTWLWTFWHLGPPLFGLAYALLERPGQGRSVVPGRENVLGGAAVLSVLAYAGLVTLLVTRDVHLLPKTVDGDDYALLTSSGVGPAVVALTLAALAALVWTTRLRTVLQLWLAVSLVLLLLDNWVTMAGSARGTVGWFAGRLEALIAGLLLLGVYLREVDFLYARAERTAEERERERAALGLARDNLALALEAAEMGDWHLDLADDTIRRTLESDRIFGYETAPAAWHRAEFMDRVVPDDRAAVEAAFADALTGAPLEFACRIRRADTGAERSIAVRGKTYLDEAGRPVSMTGVLMDTTERRDIEERLAQAQKMEAIGQLTGGVAHDFNNLLTVIVGNLDMILRQPDNAGRVQRLAASSLKAARHGAEVTEKLLAFSRRQVVRAETVNPNRLLKDFEALLRRAVGETIEVRLDLDPFLHPVRLDPGQFESAILNLARERPRRHAGRRPLHGAHLQRGRWPGRPRRPLRARAGRPHPGSRVGYGHGHGRRHDGARLRALLHDQGRRQGHGSRPQPGLRLRQAGLRPRPHRERGRGGHDRPPLAAPLGRARGRPAARRGRDARCGAPRRARWC